MSHSIVSEQWIREEDKEGSMRKASLRPEILATNDSQSTQPKTDSVVDIRVHSPILNNLRPRERVYTHLEHFFRVLVVGTPLCPFFMIVDKRQTIEYLSHQIEAEIVYRQMPADLSEQEAGSFCPIVFQCDLIFSKEQPLALYDKIGDVLEPGDEVEAASFFLGSHPIALIQHPSSTCLSGELSTSLNTRRVSLVPRQSRRPSFIHDISFDTRLIAILSNYRATELFLEFCIETKNVESILFWLEVETYRVASSFDADIYRLYLFLSYIVRGGPLEINITDEIRDEILFSDCGTSEKALAVFDEAQRRIYAFLKGHLLVKFEESELGMKLTSENNDNHQFLYGTHVPSKKKMLDRVKQLLQVSELDLDLSCDSLCMKTIQGLYHSECLRITGSGGIRNELLTESVRQFFPNWLPIVTYYQQRRRHSIVTRQKKQQKQRRINKFFGDRPAAEELSRQMSVARPTLDDSHSNDLNTTTSVMLTISSCTVEDDKSQKRKKVEKLLDIFGAKIPDDSLQHQTEQNSTGSQMNLPPNPLPFDTDLMPIVTQNELSPEQKKLLTKRAQKLAELLGHSPNEELASYVKKEAGERDASTLLTPIEGKSRRISSPSISFFTQRSNSVSGPASANPTDTAAREYRRKKLKKLQQFLGEKVPQSLVSMGHRNGDIMTSNDLDELLSDESKFHSVSRRLSILRVEDDPDIPENLSEEAMQYLQMLRGMRSMLLDTNQCQDLLSMIASLEGGEDQKEEPQDSLSIPRSNRRGRSLSFSVADVKARATKRTEKVASFFGVGKEEILAIMQNTIWIDIEKSIMDEVTDLVAKAILKKELNTLKAYLTSISWKSNSSIQNTTNL